MDTTEATRRVAEFHRTYDPRALWPTVGQEDFAAAMREIVRIASVRLGSAKTSAIYADPIPGGLDATGAAAFASGLGPLLAYWIETGTLTAPSRVADLLCMHLDHGRRRARKLRAELARIVALLAGEGIEVTVLKGMHTGWVYFPDPGTRTVSDIDILIAPGQAVDAARLLHAAGFRRTRFIRERSTWQVPGSEAVASASLTHADNPWSVDLHETLDRRFPSARRLARFGVLDDRDRRLWEVDGMRAWVLAEPLLACYLSVHASHHVPFLSPVRVVELALMCRSDGEGAFPWERLADRLERTESSGFAYPALKLLKDLVPGSIPSTILDQLGRATPSEVRRFMARMTPATALQMYHRSFEGRFLWAGTGWSRLREFLAWLWPRNDDGVRLPPSQAIVTTTRRLSRLIAGRMTWRVR